MYNTEISFSTIQDIFQAPDNFFEVSIIPVSLPETYSIHFLVSDNETKDSFPLEVPGTPLFKAREGEVFSQGNIIYVGLGFLKKLLLDEVGSGFLKLFSTLKLVEIQKVQIILDPLLFNKFSIKNLVYQCIVALEVGAYSTAVLKTKNKKTKNIHKKQKIFFVISEDDKRKPTMTEINKWLFTSKNLNGMRLLQSLPSNYATPKNIEEYMRVLSKKHKLKLKSFGVLELEKIKAFGILSVGKSSLEAPRMLQLEYIPKVSSKKKHIPKLVLIGKGVTFDSGGISIKPSSDMHEMKYDMSGAAAVLHSIVAIAELEIPVHVVVLVGLVENMPSGNALKPGDVYTSMKGITVEVQNTDAEGRLVLADLLYYGEQFKPDLMINLATLTGACVIALGNYYAALFSRDDNCIKLLKKAAKTSLEPLWHLPMGGLYEKMLSSDIADYNNIGGRGAGSSTAATFLSFFVDKKTPWVHLDIAGMAYAKKGFGVYPSVARGYGVRLLTEVAYLLIEENDSKVS